MLEWAPPRALLRLARLWHRRVLLHARDNGGVVPDVAVDVARRCAELLADGLEAPPPAAPT